MKPLYIDGTDTAVRLDGPALRISTPACADRWFPLGRLSRVVSSSRVEWETAALLACVGLGVTVSFLDGEGTLIARCIGRVDACAALQDRLEWLLLREDGSGLYAQWLAAVDNMALRSIVRRSGLHFVQAPDGRAVRRLFRSGAASMDALFAYERIGRETHSLIVTLVTQELSRSGVMVSRFNGEDFNLANDLADVVFWDFQLDRLRWLEQRLEAMSTVEAPARADIVRFFETRRVRTEKLIGGLIRRLHRWLVELE